MDWTAQDTIVGLATPPGKGGVAIVRVSGHHAYRIGECIFRPSAYDARPFQPYLLNVGSFVDSTNEKMLDHGMMVFMKGPKSFTGEDTIECHLHGGLVTPKTVIENIISLAKRVDSGQGGIRLAEPGEFTFRAFINQKLDLDQAEAIGEVIDAQTELERRLAVRKLGSDWKQQVTRTIAAVRQLLSEIEAELDFPDENFDFQPHEVKLQILEKLINQVHEWRLGAKARRIGREGIQIVLAGPVNAGKSTLFNALLGEERAITAATPGTTRDYLEVRIDLDGHPAQLVDTAGVRISADELETQGIAWAEELVARADIVLWLQEAGQYTAGEDDSIPKQAMRIATKMDLLSQDEINSFGKNHPEAVLLSAKDSVGVDRLRARLAERLHERFPELSAAQVSVNERQFTALEGALDDLLAAKESIQHEQGLELAANYLWGAASHLEDLSGRSLNSEVIEAIFQNFCIGK